MYVITLSVWGVCFLSDSCRRAKVNYLLGLFSYQHKVTHTFWYLQKQCFKLRDLLDLSVCFKCSLWSLPLPFWARLLLWWSLARLVSKNKVSLVSNRAQKKEQPRIFPLACRCSLEYSGFRKSTLFLISQMWMAFVHFLCRFARRTWQTVLKQGNRMFSWERHPLAAVTECNQDHQNPL